MTPRPVLIAPSILSADLARLQDEIDTIEQHADWLQIDVMDGHFVPNLSFGAPVIRCLKTKLLLDVHLMVTNPADRIDECLAAGAKHITFHAEAVGSERDRNVLIARIREGGATAGIAVNPKTGIDAIDDVVGALDLVLVMSVEPGFGGQEFLPEVLEKVRLLRKRSPGLMIQMDGGINEKNARLCVEAGANNLVAGHCIFSAKDRARAITTLRNVCA
ncbi:MAG: ribulose-phosphate 3-epimerase [Candidatus Peregrinibacteria bacterium Gr01-1014_25]|nr:MAG: ribulose-phosphate 3-epimerase [Candidatus Peregrinibacteria bacterium Gr01-1014_25]